MQHRAFTSRSGKAAAAGVLLLLGQLLPCSPAFALRPGDRMPAFAVAAGDSRLTSGDLADRVAIITYEDRGSVEVNRPFKRVLLERWRQGDPAGPAIVPVVDCASFFGFARSICADRVAQAAKREKLIIYADTDGGMARAFQPQDDQSNIFIIDKNGVTRFVRSGGLDAAAVREALQLAERLLKE